jgi:hypothetical protein
MTPEVNYFLRILKHQYPTLHNKVGISVSPYSNYQEYLGGDGRMRAELNYNSPVEYKIEIIFSTYGSLYYDIEFYVDFVWSPNEIQKKFDYVGRYHFKFTV